MNHIKIIFHNKLMNHIYIIYSYTNNEFPDEYVPTSIFIFENYYCVVFDNTITNVYIDDKVIRLNLWDTAG